MLLYFAGNHFYEYITKNKLSNILHCLSKYLFYTKIKRSIKKVESPIELNVQLSAKKTMINKLLINNLYRYYFSALCLQCFQMQLI